MSNSRIDRPPHIDFFLSGAVSIGIYAVVAVLTFYSLALVANRFGGQLVSDGYFFIASLSNLSVGFLGSLFGTVFLPALIALRAQDNSDEANRFASAILTWTASATAITAGVIQIFLLDFFARVSLFPVANLQQLSPVLYYFPGIFFFGILAEFYRVLALASGRFRLAAATAIFPPCTLIFFVHFCSPAMGGSAMPASLLLAKILVFLTLYKDSLTQGFRLRPSYKRNLHISKFFRSSVPYWSANIITNIATFFADYISSGFGVGAVTALAYAQRLYMLPISFFVIPLMEIARTKFAQLQASQKSVLFDGLLSDLSKILLIGTVPIAAFYIFFGDSFMALMFQRGNFGSKDILLASSLLSIYAVAIPFTSLFILYGRALESFQRLIGPSIAGSIGNLMFIALIYISTTRFHQSGIPLAKTMIDIIYFVPFSLIALRCFGAQPAVRLTATTLLLCCGAASAATSTVLVGGLINDYTGAPPSLMGFFGGIVLFATSYIFILACISNDVRSIFKQVLSARKD